MDTIFQSKFDKLVIARVILLLVSLFVYMYILDKRLHDLHLILTGDMLGIIVVAFGILVPFATTYKVTKEGSLVIPAGIRKIKINISGISSIKAEKSWVEFIFSLYVNSPDQLKLSYGKNSTIMISPKDKDEFIKTLQNKNPGIILE